MSCLKVFGTKVAQYKYPDRCRYYYLDGSHISKFFLQVFAENVNGESGCGGVCAVMLWRPRNTVVS